MNSPSLQLPPLSLPWLFARSRSLNRFPDNPQQESPRPQSSKARPTARSASSKEDSQELLGVALCSAEVEEFPADFQICRVLKLLLNFKHKRQRHFKSILIQGCTHGDYLCSLGWEPHESYVESHRESSSSGHKVGRNGASPLKKAITYCSGQVPIYVHPSFYRSLKLKYPLDDGWSRDGRVTTELGTESLRHAVGVLTLEDFCAVFDSEKGKWVWWL